jgi:prevent-host-death family protein
MSETLPLAEARNRLSELGTLVETTHERVVVTRNGRPAFVLVSPDDIESMEETLSLLSDPAAMADIAQSQAEHTAGHGIRMTKDEMLTALRTHRQDDARG